ncbi:MAG: hypothetical protein ACAI44_31565 [Candidatus Sericytochromatia bacterium]
MANKTPVKGHRESLRGYTAEAMVALKLSQTGTLQRVDTKFQNDNGTDKAEIDFITGSSFVKGEPENSRIFSMGEVKAGEDKSKYKDNAPAKFEVAQEYGADRFLYVVDNKNQQSLNKLKQSLGKAANDAEYFGFNPETDIVQLRDFIPDFNSCDPEKQE